MLLDLAKPKVQACSMHEVQITINLKAFAPTWGVFLADQRML